MSTGAQGHMRPVPGPEDLYPMLRAENAEVVIHPDDDRRHLDTAVAPGGRQNGPMVARAKGTYLVDVHLLPPAAFGAITAV